MSKIDSQKFRNKIQIVGLDLIPSQWKLCFWNVAILVYARVVPTECNSQIAALHCRELSEDDKYLKTKLCTRDAAVIYLRTSCWPQPVLLAMHFLDAFCISFFFFVTLYPWPARIGKSQQCLYETVFSIPF